jgi:hypothetical protein
VPPSGEEGVLVPPELVRVLERAAEERGLSPEAVLAELLLRLAEPGEKPGILVSAARSLLRHADELAERGDLAGAARRLWSAGVLAAEAVAAARGVEPGGLRDYWGLLGGLGEKALCGWYAAIAAFVAHREGAVTEEHYRAMRGMVEGLVEAVGEEVARG